MKKQSFFLLLMIMLLTPKPFQPVDALTTNSAPYITYTIGPNGRYVQTQTAYEPAGEIDLSLSLKNPEDMVLKGQDLYIADTGNQRILRTDLLSGTTEILVSNLNQPTGIHVDDLDRLYIADRGNRAVYVYDASQTLVTTYTKPLEVIFGETSPFIPLKVMSGPRGIVYIVGEGSTSGLIQLNAQGEFLGFFGSNTTTLSWPQVVSNFFGITRALNIPTSPSNITMDQKGTVYTSSNLQGNQLKKFNIASQTILTMNTPNHPIAIHVNDFDNIYSLTTTGIINEFDSYGNLIFQFGGLDTGNRITGLFVNPVDLDIDDNNNILVLDKALGTVHYFQRSEFAKQVHQGLINFKNGIYSIEEWEDVLKRNSLFALANAAIARGYYRLQQYSEALFYYLFAFDQIGYSEAFWQLRYQWLELNLTFVFLAILGYVVLERLLTWAHKRYRLFGFTQGLTSFASSLKVSKELHYATHILSHPLDTYQDIKYGKKSSYGTALLLFGLVVILALLEVYGTGFIFSTYNLVYFNAFNFIVMVLGGLLLFVFSNYLVATITDGEGWFKDVFIATSYALIPFILITPVMIGLSHVLTLNETIVFQILDVLRWGWTGLLIVLMIKEVHNFDFQALIKNILLTVFVMMMVILVLFLLYILSSQLFNFLEGIIREGLLRA
jgi:hypothetical protein